MLRNLNNNCGWFRFKKKRVMCHLLHILLVLNLRPMSPSETVIFGFTLVNEIKKITIVSCYLNRYINISHRKSVTWHKWTVFVQRILMKHWFTSYIDKDIVRRINYKEEKKRVLCTKVAAAECLLSMSVMTHSHRCH